MILHRIALTSWLFLTALPGMAGAVEVYRWVDADGVVHFSQWRPASAPTPVQAVVVAGDATEGVGGDIYPVEELAEAIAALRDERRRDRELARRQAEVPRTPTPALPYVQPVAYDVWPWRPPLPDRPEPPERPQPPTEPEPTPSLPYRPPGQATDEP